MRPLNHRQHISESVIRLVKPEMSPKSQLKSKCYDIDFNHFVFGNLPTFLFWPDVFNAAAVFFK